MFKPSKELIEFIKKKEGLRTQPYKDFDGRAAVGYGDTANVTGPISEAEAESRLIKRLEEGGTRLAQTIKRPDLSQSQIDSILDMEYNIGLSKLERQGFIDLVNSGDDVQVAESMGRFTKAKNERGEFVELPGLVERARARQSMWGSKMPMQSQPFQGGTDIFSGAVGGDIDSAIGSIDLPAVAEATPSIDDAINQIEVPAPKSIDDAIAGISFAAELNDDPAYVGERARVKSFAQQEKIPFDEAEALIFERDPKVVKLKQQIPEIADNFGPLAKWASDPVNFSKLAQGPDAFTKIVVAARPYNPTLKDDFTRALKENAWIPEESYTMIAAVHGAMTPQKAQQVFKEIDEKRKVNPYSRSTETVMRAFGKWTQSLGEQGAAGVDAITNIFKDEGSTLESLKQAYNAGAMTAEETFELMKAIKDNPRGLPVIAAQTLSSAGIGLAGRAAGSFLGPVGQVAGAFTAATSFAYGAKLKQYMEPFRDEQTGEIDMVAALSDPKRVAKWKNLAAQYAVSMGAVDTVFTMQAGASVAAAASRAGTQTGRLAQAATVAGGLARGAVKDAAGEGLSEAAGSIQEANVAQFYGEKFNAKKFFEILGTSAEEFTVGLVLGPAMEGAAALPSAIRSTNDAINVTLKKRQQSTDAKNNFENAKVLRQAIEENKNLTDEDARELIAATVTSEDVTPPVPEMGADDINIAAETEEIYARKLRGFTSGQVEVSAREFDAFFAAQGLDPIEALNKLDPSVIENYAKAKEEKGSFSVSAGDWFVGLKEYEGIDLIARFNGSDMNAIEGLPVFNQLDSNPFQILEETQEPPPIPGDEPPPIPSEAADFITTTGGVDRDSLIIETVEEEGSDLILRPVELVSRFRSEQDKKVFKDMVSKFKQATKKSPGVAPEAVEIIADLELERFKYRSRVLGKPVSELYSLFGIGTTSRAGAKGLMGRQSGFRRPYYVAFNVSADEKTLIHELGHSWLHELSEDYAVISQIPEAERTLEQKEMLELSDMLAKEYQARGIKLNNIGEIYNRSDKEVTEIHEIFSQTTEMWAFEGKHENNRLRSIMEAFRKWLTRLANIMGKTYPEYPPFKLNPALERLFTVLTNADEKVSEELLPMFPKPEFPPGFLGKDEDKYMDAWRDALSEATGSFYANIMNLKFADRERAIRKAMNDIRDEAAQDVDQTPPMLLLQKFKSLNEQRRNGTLDFEPRISDKTFREFFANNDQLLHEQLKSKIPKDFIAKANKGGGLDADQVMAQMGFQDKQEFLDMLIEAGRRDELIEQRVKTLTEERFPILKTDEEIHQEAVKALNGMGKEKFLNRTFNILKDKYPTEFKRLIEKGMLPQSALGTKDVKDHMKKVAMAKVLDSSVVNFNPQRLMQDSDRLGKDAAAMFRKGNIAEAMELKYQQSIMFYEAQQGFGLLKEISKTEALRRKIPKILNNRDKLKTDYDVDVLTYAKALIDQEAQGGVLLPMNPAAISVESGVEPSIINKVNEAVEALAVLQGSRRMNQRSIEFEMMFGELLNMLTVIARNAKKVEVAGVEMALDAAESQIAGEVGPPQKQDPKLTRQQVDQAGLVPFWHRRTFDVVPLPIMLSSLSTTDEQHASSVLGRVMNDVQEAEAKKNILMNDIRKVLNEKGAKAFGKSGAIEFVKGFFNEIPLLNPPGQKPIPMKLRGQNKGVTLEGKAELIVLIAQALGSKAGMEAVLLGGVKGSGPIGGFDPVTKEIDEGPFMEWVEGLIADKTLVKEDFEFIQALWDSFRKIYPELKKSQRKVMGYNVGHIDGRPVKTSIWEGEGGYVPLFKAQDIPFNAQEMFLDPGASQLMNGLVPPAVGRGNTLSRTGLRYDVDLDLAKVLSKINHMANLAYVYPSLVTFGRIMNRQGVRDTLEARRPGIVSQSVIPWLKRTALQNYTEPSTGFFNVAARILRAGTVPVYYLGNLVSGALQLVGTIQAIPVVGARNFVLGWSRFIQSPVAAKREVIELSPRMKSRFDKGQQQLIDARNALELSFGSIGRTKQLTQAASMFFIQHLQNVTDVVTWHAGYMKALGAGANPKAAAIAATNAVEKTQGSTGVSGLANVQYGNEIQKLLTQMLSNPIALRGVLYEGGARNEDNMKRLSFYVNFVFTTIILSKSIEEGLRAFRKSVVKNVEGEEDEDEKKRKRGYSEEAIEAENAKRYMLSIAGQGLETVMPVAGRYISPFVMGTSLRPVPAAATAFKAASGTVQAAKDTFDGVSLTGDQVKDILDAATMLTGIPFTLADFGISLMEGEKSENEKAIERYERAAQKRMNRFERMQ